MHLFFLKFTYATFKNRDVISPCSHCMALCSVRFLFSFVGWIKIHINLLNYRSCIAIF